MFCGSFEIQPVLHAQMLDALARIYAECFSAEPWNERWSIESAREEIVSSLGSGHLIVCRREGEIAGFGLAEALCNYSGRDELLALGIDPGAYYIKELATAVHHRRNSICSALIALFGVFALPHHSALVLRTRINNTALFGAAKNNGLAPQGEYEAITGGIVSRRVVFGRTLRD